MSLYTGFQAITRGKDNKSKRDERIPLHPLVVDHLETIRQVKYPEVFPWPHGRRMIWDEFHVIQEAAGIHLECYEKHEHGRGCFVYGFLDARRGFATFVGNHLGRDQLQKMMRHKDYSTTQRYIDGAAGMQEVPSQLNAPAGLDKTQVSRKNSGA